MKSLKFPEKGIELNFERDTEIDSVIWEHQRIVDDPNSDLKCQLESKQLINYLKALRNVHHLCGASITLKKQEIDLPDWLFLSQP